MAPMKFCFCFDTRTGTIFTGFYSLVSSAVFIGLLLLRFLGCQLLEISPRYEIVLLCTLVVFGLLMISSFILVIVAYKDMYTLFYPWIVCAILAMIEGASILIWHVATEMMITGVLQPWEAVILTFHGCNTVFTCYCLSCVSCHLKNLKQGKPTDSSNRQQRTQPLYDRTSMIPSCVRTDVTALGDFDTINDMLRCRPMKPPAYVDKPPEYSTTDRQSRSRTPGVRREIYVVDMDGCDSVRPAADISPHSDPREPRASTPITVASVSTRLPQGIPPPVYDVISPAHDARHPSGQSSIESSRDHRPPRYMSRHSYRRMRRDAMRSNFHQIALL